MKNISKIITMAIAIILSVSFFGPFHDHTTAEACEEAPQSYDLSVIENWCGSGTEAFVLSAQRSTHARMIH